MEQRIHVRRHELKFYISRTDYEYAKRAVANVMPRDKHQKDEYGYLIRSLYFDDMLDNAVKEKLDGIDYRDKYRLRIYDTKQDWVKFERKRKLTDYIEKDTGIISRADANKFIAGDRDILLKYDNGALNSIYFDFTRKHFWPVAMIDYYRDAYMMDFNNIRVTFDRDIRRSQENHDLFDSNIMTNPVIRDDIVVMEVKYNGFLPPWFTGMLNMERFQRSAISKYVMSRRQSTNFNFI